MAIVRMNMMNKTKKALSEAGISSMTARDALGRGKGLVDYSPAGRRGERIRGGDSPARPQPAADPQEAIFVVVPDNLVDTTVKTIIRVNRTGKSGDGKIFVMPVQDSVCVRTGEMRRRPFSTRFDSLKPQDGETDGCNADRSAALRDERDRSRTQSRRNSLPNIPPKSPANARSR